MTTPIVLTPKTLEQVAQQRKPIYDLLAKSVKSA